MHRRLFMGILVCLLGVRAWAEDPQPLDPTDDQQQNTSDQEPEAKGIIPEGGLAVSTQPITPIALLGDRNLYDLALSEVSMAEGLLKKGKVEAASDLALEAYDDLVAVRASRRNKKKRRKLRADRHHAATVYMEASMAYIDNFVKNGEGKSGVNEEGRARLADLRDVSMNYPELNKKLTLALERYTVTPSTSTPQR